MAINQEDFMRAFLDDDSLWKPMFSVFTPGTPLYNEEGSEILKGPRNLDAARRLLVESGYAGQPVTCLAAQDIPFVKAWGDVIAPLLTRLGMNIDFVATDWGTVVARWAQKSPPGQGGMAGRGDLVYRRCTHRPDGRCHSRERRECILWVAE